MDPITQNWLELQCSYIEQVVTAVVLLGAPGMGSYEPMACWPAETAVAPVLQSYSERLLSKGISSVYMRVSRDDKGTFLACPINVGEQCFGIVAIYVQGVEKSQQQQAARALEWGCEWFAWLARERKSSREQDSRLLGFVEVLALALKHEDFHQTAKVIADSLLERSGCSRVCIGVMEKGSISVAALSGSQAGENVLAIAKPIQQAMEEAADQSATIYLGEGKEDLGLVTYAHQQLMAEHAVNSVCSIPMLYNEAVVGVISYENIKTASFDSTMLRFSEQVALLLGPIMLLKKDRGGSSVKRAILNSVRAKVIAAVIVLSAVLLCFIPGRYDVAATAVIESDKKQMVLAALDGFIVTATARAGDEVEEGQLLATIDDQDLQLEWQKWRAKKAQFMKSYNNALGSLDRTEIHIYKAQLEQADAQLSLLSNQLSRTKLVAPFSGVVVSGDLSQSLGVPVKRGDLLYEIAPVEQYRLLLKVDERDIVALAVGQRGEVNLSSMPGNAISFEISKITPVSVTTEGSNFFYVEAILDDNEGDAGLSPGMTGVAKVDAGERAYMWIWFHRSVDWLRLWYWRL